MKNKSSKDWTELTDGLSTEDFKKLSPFVRLNCAECVYLKGRVSLWCTNKEAIEKRGTSIPGISNCPCWEADWNYISEEYKTKENGYKEVVIRPSSIPKRHETNSYNNYLFIIGCVFLIFCFVVFIFNNR
jgi:hypothetical protein